MAKAATNRIEMIGRTFGRLKVIGEAEKKTSQLRWLCLCACGNTTDVDGYNLRSDGTQSCGCLQAERAGNSNSTHRKTDTRLYRTYRSMRTRCENPNCKAYPDYGGRGIFVCDEWKTFEGFMRWVEISGYDETLTIDRIDNDKGYSPDNCKWSTAKEQANNRRRAKNQKLDEKQIEQIRLADGTLREIAARFSISQAHACNIRNGNRRALGANMGS